MWTLSVTVLRAENIQHQDYCSEADCYVTLCLPSASSKTYRTKTVANKQNPEWNETFTIHTKKNLKNILEIVMYDEDPMKPDDVVSSLEFDIDNLTVGKKETKEFSLKEKVKLFLALELQKREENIPPQSVKKELVSYLTLNTTVRRAKIRTPQDGSQSNWFVTLSLPSAAATACRTKTVSNNGNPEWNETFTFRFTKNTKCVMEIKLYDEDPLKKDNMISTLLFDLEILNIDAKETKIFLLNSEADDELAVEFEVLNSEQPNSEYISNGILMGGPFSVLDVNVEELTSSDSIKDKMLTLKGAYMENHPLNSQKSNQLRYYINRDMQTALGLVDSDTAEATAAAPMVTSVKIEPLEANTKQKVSLKIEEGTVDLELHTHESEDEPLAVRLQSDIPPQEKEFLKKRKVIVGQGLQKLLNLSSPPEPKKMPTIALVGSGGGTRAMTGLLGSLKGLKELGVVDAVTYITGVSGSTWTMSTLYQDDHWSQQDIDFFISAVKEKVSKNFISSFSYHKLKYYYDEIKAKENDGHTTSYIDMWGLIIEHLVFEKKTTSTLSDQKSTVNEGQNPLPIYCAVNMKDGITDSSSEAEWTEFTPYEVGIKKYGAFVRAQDFGSHFFLGHLIKKLPEMRLPFLMGIWSSAFSMNIVQLLEMATGIKPTWIPWLGSDVDIIEPETEVNAEERTVLDTYVLGPITAIGNMATNFFKTRPIVAEMYNFMRGLLLHWNYCENSNFLASKENHVDAFPNNLTPSDPTLCLVDAGHAINIGCIPVLHPERDVDLIISLSYSWDKHFLNVISKTAAYCQDHSIPFPSADFASIEEQPEREIYVFEDKENPKAPIVIHLPIDNITFKEFKEPGKRRETEEEVKAGQVDVSSMGSPYRTKHMTISKENYQALVDLTTYNILNNKEIILETIRKVVEKKASKD
ncbi:cytosolic phospholipase A2 beta-like [Genypterus blacodes]|uniref:cytosolic phospholipase A2 beta-like n=1 Tax=Genypterus blacodes TaxID=154954 RepID=UPI003F76F2E2